MSLWNDTGSVTGRSQPTSSAVSDKLNIIRQVLRSLPRQRLVHQTAEFEADSLAQGPYWRQHTNDTYVTRHLMTMVVQTNTRQSTRETNHNCQMCDEAFTRPESLNMHMRIHTEFEPFECVLQTFCTGILLHTTEVASETNGTIVTHV